MSEVYDGLERVQNLMDDVFIYKSRREKHGNRLKEVLELLAETSVTLNTDKCQLRISTNPKVQ